MNTPLRARIRGVLMISVLRAAKSQYAPAPAAESKAAEAGTKRIEATVIERCRLLHFLYAQSRVLAGIPAGAVPRRPRSEEHTSELQSRGHLVCRLLLEKKKKKEVLSKHHDH